LEIESVLTHAGHQFQTGGSENSLTRAKHPLGLYFYDLK